MAMNLEAVLRIAAKVVGLDEVTALERGIGRAEKAASQAEGAFKAVVGSASWQAAAAGAVAFGAAIGLSAKAAIDFESSMADVRKVVSGLETPKAFGEIKQEILDLSRQMPITAKGFAEIYAAAGQSGIARDQLKEFATLVAQVAVAFDMTAQEAGQALAQMKVALGLTTPELRALADSLNYISNSSGATASNLVEFMSRAGAVGKLAGLTGQQTAAFGAAMIQAGINTEVAATSFNNMIKALSKGPSMTDRQVDALRRLGYSMANATQIEQELTRVAETESRRRIDLARQQGNETVRVAEEQSRRRIEIAREETNQLNREINRRYRDQLQALQDNWDDQTAIREEALQDQADSQIKALQRQQDFEIKAAQDRARALNISADAEVNAIRDGYERRIDQIRDGTQRQLTVERRAARDQQQTVRDRLQDQQDAELQGVNRRFEATQEVERRRIEAEREAARQRLAGVEQTEQAILDKSRAAAKKTGEQMAAASAQGFADRLQTNAIGTITEVLGKIASLPKAQQLSVLSDLFGDEARGLAPMLANLGELERLLGLAGDKAGYTGSVMEEFRVRSETAANKLQLFQNNLTALQIVVGEKVLPALVKLLEVFGPILIGLTQFAEAHPGITTLAVAIGSVVSAFVLLAPFIISAISLFGSLKAAIVALNIGGLIAGWLPFFTGLGTAIIGALAPVLAWITGTLLPGLLAVFSGPVGWTVLAVAAVVAMAVAFREPIMQFIAWFGDSIGNAIQAIWKWTEPYRAFWMNAWNLVINITRTSLQTIGGILSWGMQFWYAILWQLFVQPFINLWTNVLRKPVTDALTWIAGALQLLGQKFQQGMAALATLAYAVFVKPWVDLWNNVFREPVIGALQWISRTWVGISRGFTENVIKPMQRGWTTLLQFLPQAMERAVNFVRNIWTGMIRAIQNALRGFLVNIANSINTVAGLVNNVIRGFNNLPGPDIGFVPRVMVPAFATGGVVDRATVALVGEGGEREYIVPESKMRDVSAAYLAGARGDQVFSAGAQQLAAPLKQSQPTAFQAAAGGNAVVLAAPQQLAAPLKQSQPTAFQAAAGGTAVVLAAPQQLAVPLKQSQPTGLQAAAGGTAVVLAAPQQLAAPLKQSQPTGLQAAAGGTAVVLAAPQQLAAPIPQFASGAVVDRATVALVGEAGREYIVPESKMAAASSRFLSGARGADVMSSSTPQSSGSTGPVQINVTTGPVMEFKGERYVKLEELDRAMRITVEGVIGRMRTPAARKALGWS